MSGPVLRAAALSRSFPRAGGEVRAVTDVDLELHPGELVVLRGPSGSGKTTLLNMLGGLDRPTSGEVWIGDRELSIASEDELSALRSSTLGFVFQSFALLPMLTAAENIEVPLRILRTDPAERDARVRELLDLVGLGQHANQRPDELSGGQQQRVGIARALANRPQVLIADEPTGQLDSRTAVAMMTLISELVHEQGAAGIVSTHDPLMASFADRTMAIHDGHLTTT
ncbi:ABC transporter ATP-binding protein [Naasia lichenicola]|uniref:ABC transporter ATP-binding protein n=1 Tax=Naasia lichenicola TaxID=2565933 RepID=A0A4S4FKW4_9MICO|nr:ABC transporter ATP-binding protein [Naasia lichenicola]THG30989.1 ABC transporter ATP-binding protein [Naasia lichenicola]